MAKHIAFISIHGDPLATLGGSHHGGQNVYVKELARHLCEWGFSTDVFSRWEAPDQQPIENIREGARVIRVQVGPPQCMAKEETILLLSELADWITHYQAEHQIEYQLIHGHYYFSGAVSLILQEKWGIPFIETFHSLGAVKRKTMDRKDPSPIQRFELEQRICQNADRIISTAPQEMEDLVEIYNTIQNKIEIIPCGVNLNLFRPESQADAKKFTGFSKDKFLVTYVGRLELRKGINTLLEAIGIIIGKQPNLPVHAVIVGGSHCKGNEIEVLEKEIEEFKLYQETIRRYQISDRVKFTGGKPQELLYHYYSAGDVTVIPSYYEPFGMTATEALACGSSVIASSVGGLKTTVREGHVGLQFEPQNPQDLAKKILYLVEHPQENKRFRQNARPYAEERYSWRSVSRAIASVYERVQK